MTNMKNTNIDTEAAANKIVEMMLVVITSMFDRWAETIGPRLMMVGAMYQDVGITPIPDKFLKHEEGTTYTSSDVYELHSYFHTCLHGGITLANTYYGNQILEKFEFLDTIKAAKEVIDDIMKSPMMNKMLTAERQMAVTSRASQSS